MMRRFVNLMAENRKSGMYSLHRLEAAKHLFYPSTTEAKAAAAATEANSGGLDVPAMSRRLHQLPVKTMSFYPSPPSMLRSSRLEFFGLVSPSRSESRIFCSNSEGHALLFDADQHANMMMPSLNRPKGYRPISFSIGHPDAIEEDLYLLSIIPDKDTCFEVLRFGPYHESILHKHRSLNNCWHWVSLPPPPFIFHPDYMPDVTSRTVVGCGGRTICISSLAEGMGTYCFDTIRREWCRAGDWVLPFQGTAQYIPELKLWLGFSRGSNHLCATLDLVNISDVADEGPELLCTWPDLITPEEWICGGLELINLGSGRFCIVKVFHAYHSRELAVLTGVELVTSGKDDKPGIVPHKSISYMFDEYDIQWLF